MICSAIYSLRFFLKSCFVILFYVNIIMLEIGAEHSLTAQSTATELKTGEERNDPKYEALMDKFPEVFTEKMKGFKLHVTMDKSIKPKQEPYHHSGNRPWVGPPVSRWGNQTNINIIMLELIFFF